MTSASQISYFSLGDKNRFARRPDGPVPLDCTVMIDSFWTGPKGCQMRTDQIADVWRELRRKPGGCSTVRAAHALALMLGHRDGDHRQLLDLMTRRLTDAHALGLSEDVPAAATGRPVLDDLVDRPRRQQRPPFALRPV